MISSTAKLKGNSTTTMWNCFAFSKTQKRLFKAKKFYCPFKDCSALLVDDKNENNEVIAESKCPKCNRLFCAQCKVPWHPGIDCVEFQKLNKDERSSEDIMMMNLAKSKNWMKCPSCRIYIEKTTGCSFMSCRCGHHFVYGHKWSLISGDKSALRLKRSAHWMGK